MGHGTEVDGVRGQEGGTTSDACVCTDVARTHIHCSSRREVPRRLVITIETR